MGKITRAEPADIIVLVTGRLFVSSKAESDLKTDRKVISSIVSSWLKFGLEGKRLYRDIIIDVIVCPEYVYSVNKEHPQNKVDVKICPIDEEVKIIVHEKEENISKKIKANLKVGKMEFDYNVDAKSICFER